jgi:hypothetical protein
MPQGYALSEGTKDRIWELRGEGLSDAEVGRRLGLGRTTVSIYLRALGGNQAKGAAQSAAMPEPRGARGDLARDSPRAIGTRDRPGPRSLPHDDRP